MGLDLLVHFIRTIQPHFVAQLQIPSGAANSNVTSTPSKSKAASNQGDFAGLFLDDIELQSRQPLAGNRFTFLTAYVNEDSLSK
jgi:hypothetical protein